MSVPVVLLIEDNPGDAALVRDAFQAVGFACTLVCVENVVLAYSYLFGRAPYAERAKPDLIVLDLNLPIIKGSEFMREMRRSDEWRRIPVIVFSSSNEPADKHEMLALGALRYLVKPPVWSQFVDAARVIRTEWSVFSGEA